MQTERTRIILLPKELSNNDLPCKSFSLHSLTGKTELSKSLENHSNNVVAKI